MKTITSIMALVASSFLLPAAIQAQETRTFNQNSSRSNHTRGLSIYFSPVYSSPLGKTEDSLLFRGSGAGVKFGGDYFFNNIGLGVVSGFSSSMADDALINDFLKRSGFPPDQLIITKSAQQNMYLLLGPTVRWGKTVQLYAHAKGGLFVNNGGMVNIQQKGAVRSLYRNEASTKSIYPGFQTGIGLQYSDRSNTWSFGFGADYMNTKTQMQNYDVRRGGAAEGLKLSKTVSDLLAGISVRYTIKSPRDAASGQASGKRGIVSPRDVASGQASGKRTVAPRDVATGQATGRRMEVIREEIAIDESGVHRMAGTNCGPVTQRITNPDGSTEELTFACPDDAAAYQAALNGTMPNRISTNVTVPKQTQGTTFGEKVNAGLHAAGGALAQGASREGIVHRDLAARNILSGRVSWVTESSTGIITNKTMGGGGGGGAAAASYAATGLVVNNPGGTQATFSVREAGSGQASGKREKGSGLATGRRQYEPIFMEETGTNCENCPASVKLSSVKNNPLYNDNGREVQNPLYKGRTAGGPDDDCDGVAGINVMLMDPHSGAVLAKTSTGACGDFFFANVPDGGYVVKVSGEYLNRKDYELNLGSASDLLGALKTGPSSLQILINSENNDEPAPEQKAGISTSRSNIRCRNITVIEADTDGDGEYESLRAIATYSDGRSGDISSSAKRTGISNAGGSAGLTIDERGTERHRVEVLKSNKQGDPNANRLVNVSISGAGGKIRATGTFSDGSTRDVTESVVVNTAHAGLRQYTFTIDDTDADGFGDAIVKTKTKSNQSNDRVAAPSEEEGIWSPRSNIKMIPVGVADLDGDGAPDLVGGNIAVAAAEREKLKQKFQDGDIPEGQQRLLGGALPGGAVISAMLSPGNPIGGLTIKGGKNPGGNVQSRTTNENGEFEFTNLDAGQYLFTVEQRLYIEDETFVPVGGSRVQDHNSSRSNKSSSGIAPDPDGSGGNKVQDHNSSRSNKSASTMAGNEGQDGQAERKGIVKITASQNSQSLRSGDVKVTASQNTQSLRSISVQADLDGDGVFETDVTGKVNDELRIDANGGISEPQQKTGIHTSRSNIKNRSGVQPITQTVYSGYGTAIINGKEVPVKTVYKVVEKATSGLKDTLKTQV
ncbi:MAG: carboxypeptidase regulatory-like domain-containing protein [Sphingobacteriales bacterium]|nr:carboxypeptidase regulatory-like domain-containing protein [Sphingobacteriales bacterium]